MEPTEQKDLNEEVEAEEVSDLPTIKPEISYEDFAKLDARIGVIKSAEIVEDADKLLRLEVDFGDFERQIVSGIREFFADPTELVGLQCPFLVNLKPRTIRGLESQGMILAIGDDKAFSLLNPQNLVPPGSKLA